MRSHRDFHKSGSGDSDQVLHHVCVIFKESDRLHACPAVSTPQKKESWNHHPRRAVVADTEESYLDDKYSVMPPLIYPYYSNDEEEDLRKFTSNPLSVDPILEP